MTELPIKCINTFQIAGSIREPVAVLERIGLAKGVITMTASMTSGQRDHLLNIAGAAGRQGFEIAEKRFTLGKFRAQALLQNGNVLKDTIADAVILMLERIAPKRRLYAFAVVTAPNGSKVPLVLLTPEELGFYDDHTFIKAILDQTRLTEWSEDALKGQRVKLCGRWVAQTLRDHRTCVPGASVRVAEESHEDDEHSVSLPAVDGNGEWGIHDIGLKFPIQPEESHFLFELENA